MPCGVRKMRRTLRSPTRDELTSPSSPGASGGDADGYHCPDPRIHSGDLGQPDTPSLSSSDEDLGEGEEVPRILRPPDWKSGVNIMRAIYITALKRGRADHETLPTIQGHTRDRAFCRCHALEILMRGNYLADRSLKREKT